MTSIRPIRPGNPRNGGIRWETSRPPEMISPRTYQRPRGDSRPPTTKRHGSVSGWPEQDDDE